MNIAYSRNRFSATRTWITAAACSSFVFLPASGNAAVLSGAGEEIGKKTSRVQQKAVGSAATTAGSARTDAVKKNVESPPAATENVIVTGSRGRPTSVLHSASPIDVISATQLERMGGNSTLRDALAALLPSFTTQTVGSSSWDSLARPAGMRGLGGAHVLVLVNGKRRHNSSLINLSSGNLNNGANPVDLDMIPTESIDHIEVLRDGAAAQYGSDAIAGVINIILKKNNHGGTITAQTGQRYPYDGHVDGQRFQIDGNFGFRLPNNGFFNLTTQLKQERPTIRSTNATGSFYYPLADGSPDPREQTASRVVFRGGLPENKALHIAYNMEIPITDRVTLYSFSTTSWRDALVGQNFRRPNSTNDIPEVWPNGFSPYYSLSEVDWQALIGLKGAFGPWKWDLSTTYGRDFVQSGAKDTINASLGPTSPTSFKTFSSSFRQWTNNFDMTREIDIGLSKPSQLSFGVEHRNEAYTTIAGDPTTYENGGYIYPSGPLQGLPAAVGAQGAVALTPRDQANIWRSNFAIYTDYAFNPTRNWYVDLAGRGEFYTGSAGNTGSGKLATRYDLGHGLAIRGTVSNGFRAPSVAQMGFAQTSDQYNCANAVCSFIVARTVPVNNPIAQALGATPLRPETSRSFSAGLTYEPFRALQLSVDPYLIYLDHRIVQTGFLSGSAVNQIVVANGGESGTNVRYFTNGVNTRTAGVDARISYAWISPGFGTFTFSASGNWNRTEITKLANTPSQLSGLGLKLVDRQAQGYMTEAQPKLKVILGVNWAWKRWNVNFRETWYDQVSLLADDAASDQHYDPKWIADLDINYRITRNVAVGVGANNLFNTYPSHNEIPDTNGFPVYSSISPFGYYGGYYYGRLSVTY